MNTVKRILAIAMIVIFAMAALTGCHKKGEIAVVVGEEEFTSGYYACAFAISESEARTVVDEKFAESEEETTDEIVYHKQKIDGVKYNTYVKNSTLEKLKTVSAYKALCKKAGIELSDERKKNADETANYMWSNGYADWLEPNGVSKETFFKYMTDTFYGEQYADYLYGVGGKEEIPAADVNAKLNEGYALVNILNKKFTSTVESEMDELRTKMSDYEAKLKSGDMTFEEVLAADSGEEHKHSDETTEGQPLDPHGTVLAEDDSRYSSEYFEEAKAMAVGETKLITLEEDAGLVLIVKQDITADKYYTDLLDMDVRLQIAGDDFDAEIEEYAKTLECDISNYAINQFKAKNVSYPDTTYSY